eukprot:gene18030-19836_t
MAMAADFANASCNKADNPVKVDACERIQEEYNVWKLYHPKDFIAEPCKDSSGNINWLTWSCGKDNMQRNILPFHFTAWEGGMYKLKMKFPETYPYEPPHCFFDPPIIHPNVYPSGTVALSILDSKKAWKPQITIKQVLLGIQLLLDEPNFKEPAQAEAFALYSQSKLTYEQKIKEQARAMSAS